MDECDKLTRDVLEDLAQVRESTKIDSVIDNFRMGPIGGNWTMRHLGMVYDAFKAYAYGRDVFDFCDMFGLSKAARFNVTLYGDQGAITMSKQWCHKMNWFHEVWRSEGSPRPFHFSDALLAEYEEPTEFGRFVLTLADARAVKRACELRTLRPSASAV